MEQVCKERLKCVRIGGYFHLFVEGFFTVPFLKCGIRNLSASRSFLVQEQGLRIHFKCVFTAEKYL